jgi:hypothetical protein
MNPEAQRVAIAESQGWEHEFNGDHEDPEWYWIPPNDPDSDGEPPDFLSDLNAIHSAAKAECEKRGWDYSVFYSRGRYIATIRTDDAVVDSTNPDQCAALAESLLRALNLCTE